LFIYTKYIFGSKFVYIAISMNNNTLLTVFRCMYTYVCMYVSIAQSMYVCIDCSESTIECILGEIQFIVTSHPQLTPIFEGGGVFEL